MTGNSTVTAAPPPGPLHALVDRMARHETGPEEVAATTLAAIAASEPRIRAWAHVDSGLARENAARIEADGPGGGLWGVPVGVKDLIDVAGMPTRCGSTHTDTIAAREDAACIARLRDLGALPIGKTVTTEFGYFHPGPTRNPHAVGHTPGGSSSGSAAAVAAGIVPVALGTQTAGSLTRPAAYCGVAGLVTTHGDFDTAGVTGLSPSLDTLGLLTRTIPDLYLVWAAMRGEPAAEVPPRPAPPRLRLWSGTELGTVSADMLAALRATAAAAAAAGALVRDADLTAATVALADHHHDVMAYEAVRERSAEARSPERFSTQFAALLHTGAGISDPTYRSAVDGIAELHARLLDGWEGDEFLLGPAALGAAPRGLDATGSPVLSRPWQAMGLPAVTVPGHRDARGLPLGLQLVGRPGSEPALLAAGEWIASLNPGRPDRR